MAEDNKLVEMIEFKAVAPKTALPGLDDVLNKVRAIDAAIDSLNARLSGLSTNSTFKRARSELASVLKGANVKAPFTPADTARILGIPDPKDFEAYIQKNMAAYRKVMETRGGIKGFGSAEKAAGFTQKYFREALKEAKQPMDLLHKLFGGTGLNLPSAVPVAVPAAAPLPSPSSGGSSGTGRPRSGGGGRSAGGGSDDYFTARLKVEQELERRLAQKNLSAGGRGAAFGQAASQVDALLGQHGESMSERGLEAQRLFVEKLRRKQTQQADKARAEEMASVEDRGREEERRTQERKRIQASRVREVNKGLNAEERAAAEEEAVRKASLVSQEQLLKAQQKRAADRAKAADSVRKLEQGQGASDMSHAEARGVLKQLEARGFTIGDPQSRTRVGAGGVSSSTTYSATKDEGGQRLTTSVQFLSQNGRAVSATVSELNRKLKETRAEAGALGGDFIKNTAKVAAWSLSVAALYKTMQLATSSVASFIDTNAQMARLDQVYSKVGGTTRQLTSEILGLAAANGRTSTEAEQSAIEWSRLNLTRAETNEAVRVSLIAANVAEISAAEATSSLSSVMLAYNLRVKDLATVLGEMNAVSNAYKVTNKDMLAGLSQTANVAKQAKLPLAELMGIIGGAVGTSGQTGSRIGTMMKSSIIALSNPELQKQLRTGFQFEATQGGGADIKDMSRLLGDLYVRYQNLTDAQRQNMLSMVAGKTQANRLAAALDSYVKGQVLAIQAQMNLNSAESENAKIKDTLKSKLTGLVTEWERFVAIQGGRGPGQAAGGITTALKNVLALGNTSKGSGVATGLLGVLAAIGVQLVITATRMNLVGTKGGFLGQTMTRLKGSVHEGKEAWAASEVNMLRYGQSVVRMDSASRAAIGGLTKLGMGLQSGGGFGRLFGGAIRGLALALGTLRTALPELAIISGVIFLFNKGMESVGLSSEAAERKLAGFNEEAERAGAAASAAGQAAKLFANLGKALPLMRGDDRMRALGDVAELFHPDNAGKAAALREQFSTTLKKQNGLTEIGVMLEAKRVESLRQAQLERQKEYVANKRFIEANQAEIQRLKAAGEGHFGFIGAGGRANKMAELEKQMAQRRNKNFSMVDEDTNELQAKLDADEKHTTALEKQKASLGSIADFYHAISGTNRLDQLNTETELLRAQNYELEFHKNILETDRSALLALDAERDASTNGLRGQVSAARDELAGLENAYKRMLEAGAAAGGDFPTPVGAADNAQLKKIEEARKKVEDLEASLSEASKPQNNIPEQSMLAQRQKIDEQLRKNREEMAAKEAQRQRVINLDKFKFGQESARQDALPSTVGENEGEKLLNRKKYLEREIANAGGNPGMMDAGRLLEMRHQLAKTELDITQRRKQVEQEINQLVIDRNKEFLKSLLGAGPNELIRKLAAAKMGARAGGITPAQFMAASPEMRDELSKLNPRFDPHMMDLREERGQLGKGADRNGLFDRQLELSNALAAAIAKLKDLPGVTDTARAAMDFKEALGGAVANLKELNFLPGLIQQLKVMIQGGPFNFFPVNPQAGGLQAGR